MTDATTLQDFEAQDDAVILILPKPEDAITISIKSRNRSNDEQHADGVVSAVVWCEECVSDMLERVMGQRPGVAERWWALSGYGGEEPTYWESVDLSASVGDSGMTDGVILKRGLDLLDLRAPKTNNTPGPRARQYAVRHVPLVERAAARAAQRAAFEKAEREMRPCATVTREESEQYHRERKQGYEGAPVILPGGREYSRRCSR